MSLAPGTRLGAYELIALIGVGGMGQVYRARDTKLHRDVALKFLPDAFASDPDRLARFRREAYVLAALNHPNIAHIYGLEDADATQALVMELVEGPTLADRIALGRIALDEALPIAKQIAEALEAAHEHGIVHRDLKPANIKVRDDGTVKVLDFGLAKALDPAQGSGGVAHSAAPGSDTHSPTITSPAMTAKGIVLGTAAYMAPEQARGKPVDKRADIWAFGCVFGEMLTGRRLFAGDDPTDTIASIVKDQPDLRTAPPGVRRLLHTCLEKDPRRRLRDIGDAWHLVDDVASAASPPPSHGLRPSWIAGLLVAAAALGAAASWVASNRDSAPPVMSRFVETLPASRTIPPSVIFGTALAVAPDGRAVVYRARENAENRLYLRHFDRMETTAIGDADAEEPFFSPDGQWIGYAVGPTLKRVSVRGGPAQAIATLPPAQRGASWNADGTILVGGGGDGLLRVAETGGDVRTLIKPNGRHVWYPQLLPGGRAILYTERTVKPTVADQLLTYDLATGQSTPLLAGFGGRYLATGHLIFLNGGTLFAVQFDLDRLAVRGTPTPVVEGVRPPEDGYFGAMQVAVSESGALVYLSGAAMQQRSLVWVTRQGVEEPLRSPPRAYANPRISPDGKQIALQMRDEGQDIWIWDVARAHLRQLTSTADPNFLAAWFPDSKRLVFSAGGSGSQRLDWQAADGSGSPLVLSDRVGFPTAVLGDGSVMFMTGGEDIALLASGGGEPRWTIRTSATERNAAVSPDERWIAFESNRTGRFEIYVRKLPNASPSDQDAEWPVTTEGGIAPVWSRDGKGLFYWRERGLAVSVMAVEIVPGSTFTFGDARELFQGEYARPSWDTQYDVARDGRFLLMKPVGSPRDELVIVQNWTAELQRLVPTQR